MLGSVVLTPPVRTTSDWPPAAGVTAATSVMALTVRPAPTLPMPGIPCVTAPTVRPAPMDTLATAALCAPCVTLPTVRVPTWVPLPPGAVLSL